MREQLKERLNEILIEKNNPIKILDIMRFLSSKNNIKINSFRMDLINYFSTIFNAFIKLSESLYCLNNNILEYATCKNNSCSNPVKYIGYNEGYRDYCCVRCGVIASRHKAKKTCLERYGHENPSQVKKFQDKKIITCFEKYGTSYYSNTYEFKDRCIQTCLNKYNVDNVSQLQSVKDKKKETCIINFHVENPSQSQVIKDKKKETCYSNYGYEYTLQVRELQDKRNETCICRYGNLHPSQLDIFKEKSKQTCIEKYNVEYVSQVNEYKLKSKDKCLNKYGCEYYLGSDIHRYRVKEIMNEKIFIHDRGGAIPLFSIDDYVNVHHGYHWKCRKCGNEFYDNIKDGTYTRCPICFPIEVSSSQAEQEISEFCKQYFPFLKENDRSILNGKEIDILIPEINLGIEFNGLYWHSEAQGKDSHYHINKTILASSKGIQLIHIFEDEWTNKQEIIKSILLNIMNQSESIESSSCNYDMIHAKEAEEFLNSNDLEGYIDGIHFGLYHEEMLVCVLTMERKTENIDQWQILRFTHKLNIQIEDSFKKLFDSFTSVYHPNSVTINFDIRFGIDKLITQTNFNLIQIEDPIYYNLVNFIRVKQLIFNRGVLSEDSPLEYDRIWDCGQRVYEWVNPNKENYNERRNERSN